MFEKTNFSFKIADALVILIVVTITIFQFVSMEKNTATFVKILTPEKTYIFPIDKDDTITVDGALGKSIVQIKNKKVRMLDSACPGHTCLKGMISHSGENIICLPNQVVLTIEGDEVDNVSL